jgi:hypothetical protein
MNRSWTNDAPHELGADPLLLVDRLDRECGLGLAAPCVAELLEFGRAPHLAVLDIGKHDGAELAHACRVILDEAVGDTMREPHAPAGLIETQEVVAEQRVLLGP